MQNTTATIPAALHKCKYCGAITTLPDILCIKAPGAPGGVGQDLLVAGHARVEDGLSGRRPRRPEGGPRVCRAVREDEMRLCHSRSGPREAEKIRAVENRSLGEAPFGWGILSARPQDALA